MNTKKRLTIAGLSLLAVIALVIATPARGALIRLISRLIPSPAESVSTAGGSRGGLAISTAGLDVEQRARAAHGWTSAILNSVARGSIIYYGAKGRAAGQYAITIWRSYPDRLRVEIDRGPSREAFGFDQARAWKGGVVSLTDEQAREIRAVARLCPERLFVTRAAGAGYREAGQRIEDLGSGGSSSDWTTPASSVAVTGSQPRQTVFDQVELSDSVGPAATRTNAGDIRRVYYYIEAGNSMVSTARWLEPDDPRKSIEDGGAAFTDVRVDFGDWRDVGGVKWPFRVVHSSGGRVDFKIVLNEVKSNASLADAVFQRP